MMSPNMGHNKNGVGMDNEYFASINEVSKRLSVPAYTLRYWEKQFPVAIRPTTGAGGRRYYRAETIDRLVIIRDLLYKHGMTFGGVKNYCATEISPHHQMNLYPHQMMVERNLLCRPSRMFRQKLIQTPRKLIRQYLCWNRHAIY